MAIASGANEIYYAACLVIDSRESGLTAQGEPIGLEGHYAEIILQEGYQGQENPV